ncbi:MAG: group II intron reverse transcriptase/maturase [Clostridiales bacterium]|nr:group II intron reverse transcriptase/maturase [Clostridiales bacterium]
MKKLYSLIDKIYRRENLQAAFKAVKRNNGAPGIDGETVLDFANEVDANIERLHVELATNTYVPKPVRRVEIPKADGGTRPLGIPTVRDRVVQQAFVNVVEPYFDKDFHPSSYGYRKGRSQHQAVAKASMFMKKHGLEHVVDMDLSKCFDTLNHDLLIEAVAQKVSDGRVLKLVRQFLESGIMTDGVFTATEVGSPQGGVCSPLLSNIYLDYFDQRMMKKGIRIVRYADDILIFAGTKKEAGDYKNLATKVLEEELKLTVNREKTHLTSLQEGVSFLGFILRRNSTGIDTKRVKRFKDKVREITKRNQPAPLEVIIKKLNPVLRGWLNYYRIADIKKLITGLTEWIRRRLRMIKMKQWKTYKKMHKELRRKGIRHNGLKMNVTLWKNSNVHIIHQLMPNAYFSELGLMDMCRHEVGLLSGNKVAW